MFKRFLSFAFVTLITCSAFSAEPNYVDQFRLYHAGGTAPVRPEDPAQQPAFDAAKARADFLNLKELFAQFPDNTRAAVIDAHRDEWAALRERANAYFREGTPNHLPHSLDAWTESFPRQRAGDTFRQRSVYTLTGRTELAGVPGGQAGYAVKFLSGTTDNQCYMYGMGMGMNPALTARREAVQTIINALDTDRGPEYRRMIALQFMNLATAGIAALRGEAAELAAVPRLLLREEFTPHQTFQILRAVANALSLEEYNAVLKGELLKVALETPDLLEEIRAAAGDVPIRANYRDVTLTRWMDEEDIALYVEDADLFTQRDNGMFAIKITGHETVEEGVRKYQFLHNNQALMSSGERQAAFRALGRALNRALGRGERIELSAEDLAGLRASDRAATALIVHAPVLSLTPETGSDPILFTGTETVRDAFTKLEQLEHYSQSRYVTDLIHQESGSKSPDSLIGDVRDAYSQAIHTALAGADLNEIMNRPEVYNALMTRIKDHPDTFGKKKLVALLGLATEYDQPTNLPRITPAARQMIEVATRNRFRMDYPIWTAVQQALAVTQDDHALREAVLTIMETHPSEETDLLKTFVREYFGAANVMLELTPPTGDEEVGVGTVIAHRTGNRILSAYPVRNTLRIDFAVGPEDGLHKRVVWRTNEYHGDSAIFVIPGQAIDLDDLAMRIAHENSTHRHFLSPKEQREAAAKKAAAAKLLAEKKAAAAKLAATKTATVVKAETKKPAAIANKAQSPLPKKETDSKKKTGPKKETGGKAAQ